MDTKSTSQLNAKLFEYERELYSTRWSNIRQGVVFGIFTGWISLITYLVYAIGFIVGSILMSTEGHHSLNIGDILVIVPIFARCLDFFGLIGSLFQSFSEARGAAAAVFRLIDEGNDTSINETDVWKEDIESIYNINGDIEFDNVDFNYPSRKDAPVLRNLSLIARAGQTTALVGSSGCGKSTCISLFLRYYEPSSGQIMIDGRPITDYNVKQLRQNIGVVSQEPILFGMSIYENIRFGKVNATQAEIEQAAREANAHNFIMQLPDKYETLVGERGIQLSGGEKQRIALARALVKQPTFLLLDEATSALDNVNEKIVQEALDRACKGRTTIVIAHCLTTIQNAHHIYVLDNGSVIEQGTHETLMAKEGGKYQSMVKCQQMESINDDQDDMMSKQKATEEDEKSIFKRCRLLSDSQTVDLNKYTAFATAGSKLTQRIRSKAFACLLRQEVAYFDRPENSSGAICARLSSDASAVQEMTGTRLGIELTTFHLSLHQYGNVTLSPISATSIPSFQEKVMNNVYWLFLVGTVEYLADSINNFIWTISMRIQIFRMNAALFRSLVQRSFSEARGAAAAVFQLIDEGNDANANETDVWKEDIESIYNISGDIEFSDVNFIYPSRKDAPALRNLSFIARAGQTTALVGSSGCGKYFQKQKG
ncbi:unnamed protein product [Rotaria sp. Silwood2]|nr:unnamed protein product [Rotaria sp. Silwood2]